MKTRGWIAVTLFGLIFVLGALAYANRDRIMMRVYERALDKAMARDVMATLDPRALHVGFCGTGSPLPSRDRASACTVVIAGGKLFVFDAGEGAGETLSLMGMPLGKIEGVFLTHLHSDHFEGLGPLALQRWAGTAAQTALPILGPEGTQKIADGLNMAYGPDGSYRMAHHGPVAVPPSGFGFAATVLNPGVVYDKDGVKITAFPVNHAPVAPAFGYRLDWQGKSVTISGDTAKAPIIDKVAKNTDLLVYEVLQPRLVEEMAKAAERHGQKGRAKIFRDIQTYHIDPVMAATSATAADARMLAFTHVVPSLPRPLTGLVTRGAADHYGGPIRTMRDGDLLSISGTGEPTYRNLLD